jgi:hypothetical protein
MINDVIKILNKNDKNSTKDSINSAIKILKKCLKYLKVSSDSLEIMKIIG